MSVKGSRIGCKGSEVQGFNSSLQIMGFIVAFTAILLLSVPEKSQKIQLRQISLPITAGIFLGISLILIDQAAEQTVLWSLVATRITGIAILSETITFKDLRGDKK